MWRGIVSIILSIITGDSVDLTGEGGYKHHGKGTVVIQFYFNEADKIKLQAFADNEKGIVNMEFNEEGNSIEVRYWRGLIDGLIIREKLEELGFKILKIGPKKTNNGNII